MKLINFSDMQLILWVHVCAEKKYSEVKWFLIFTCLQVNREDDTQCHQHGLLQLPRVRWEQRWFPENCGRQNTPVWGWSLQHKAGNRWVCGQCAVVQREKKCVALVLLFASANKSGSFYLVQKMSPLQFKLKVHMVVSLLVPLTVLQINYTCIYFKSLWQTLMPLNGLIIRLEIKLHLLHHHMP